MGVSSVKMPTRARDVPPKIKAMLPMFISVVPLNLCLTPRAKKKFSMPAMITAELKSVATSLTPRSLRAFLFQVNHGE